MVPTDGAKGEGGSPTGAGEGGADPPLPAWAVDTQERSRRTRARIVEATRALLESRSFERIRVEEIADEAGVSVGGFYARFPDKRLLLHYLALELARAGRQAFEHALEEELPADADLGAVVRAYVATLVDELRRHRTLIRELRRAGPARDPELRAAMGRVNAGVHGAFRRRVARVRHEIGHPAPDEAVEYGLFMVNAAAREAVLAGALDVYRVEPDRDVLVRELRRALLAYLA